MASKNSGGAKAGEAYCGFPNWRAPRRISPGVGSRIRFPAKSGSAPSCIPDTKKKSHQKRWSRKRLITARMPAESCVPRPLSRIRTDRANAPGRLCRGSLIAGPCTGGLSSAITFHKRVRNWRNSSLDTYKSSMPSVKLRRGDFLNPGGSMMSSPRPQPKIHFGITNKILRSVDRDRN